MDTHLGGLNRKRAILATVALAIVIAALGYVLRSYWLPLEPPGVLRLGEATEIFYAPHARVSPIATYPEPRQIEIDGDALVRSSAWGAPLTVKTRLLVLTTHGPAEFRVTAHWNEAGEQVEVLSGTVEARKAYASPYPEPDTLTSGEMSMINKSIDLMEKEKTDLVALRAWRDALLASISRQPARAGASTADR